MSLDVTKSLVFCALRLDIIKYLLQVRSLHETSVEQLFHWLIKAYGLIESAKHIFTVLRQKALLHMDPDIQCLPPAIRVTL